MMCQIFSPESYFDPSILYSSGVTEVENTVVSVNKNLTVQDCFVDDQWSNYEGDQRVIFWLSTDTGIALQRIYYTSFEGINLLWFLSDLLGYEPEKPFKLSHLKDIHFTALLSRRYSHDGKVICDFSDVKVLP